MKKKLLLFGLVAAAGLSIGIFAAGCGGGSIEGTHHDAKAPTCTSAGNVEYWEHDGKYYANHDCTSQLTSVEIAPDLSAHVATGNWIIDAVNHRHYKVCTNNSEHKAIEASCTPSDEWTVKKVADSKGNGTVVKKCTECGQELETKKVVYHARVAATCSNAGSVEHYTLEGDERLFSDTACNSVLADASSPLDNDTHKWKVDYVSKNGKHWLECEYNPAHRTLAEDCRTATVPEYDSDAQMHYVICKDCGSHIGRGETHKSEELWTAKVVAGVGQNGTIVKKCKDCGYVTATGTVVYHAAVAPTCTVAGTVEYYTISGATEVYSDAACNNILRSIAGDPATGEHVWEWVVDTPATTTAAGKKHERCTLCGITQSFNTEIPMLTADSGTVKINDTTYSKPSQATGADGVTYDQTENVYVVEVGAGYRGGLNITVTDRSVVINVTAAATIDSLTIDATVSDKSVTVSLKGEPLTVSGAVVSKGVNLVLLGNLVARGGIYANRLTVGNAENSVNPTVNIKRSLTNDIAGYGKKAVEYTFLSGTVYIEKDTADEVAAGVDIRDENNGSAGSKITIAQHATVVVNGYYGGVHSEKAGNATLSVSGKLQIGTVKLEANIEQAPPEERDLLIEANNSANSAIKNFAVTVMGGTLEYSAANTGIMYGSLTIWQGTVNGGADACCLRNTTVTVKGGTLNLYAMYGDGNGAASACDITVDGGTINSYGKYIGGHFVLTSGQLNASSCGTGWNSSDYNIFLSSTVDLNGGRAVLKKTDSGGAPFWGNNCVVTVKDACDVYIKDFARITHDGATMTIENKKVKCENLDQLGSGDHQAKDCGIAVGAGTTPDFTLPVKPTIPTLSEE